MNTDIRFERFQPWFFTVSTITSPSTNLSALVSYTVPKIT